MTRPHEITARAVMRSPGRFTLPGRLGRLLPEPCGRGLAAAPALFGADDDLAPARGIIAGAAAGAVLWAALAAAWWL